MFWDVAADADKWFVCLRVLGPYQAVEDWSRRRLVIKSVPEGCCSASKAYLFVLEPREYFETLIRVELRPTNDNLHGVNGYELSMCFA